MARSASKVNPIAITYTTDRLVMKGLGRIFLFEPRNEMLQLAMLDSRIGKHGKLQGLSVAQQATGSSASIGLSG
jgi:hypothetical protein